MNQRAMRMSQVVLDPADYARLEFIDEGVGVLSGLG